MKKPNLLNLVITLFLLISISCSKNEPTTTNTTGGGMVTPATATIYLTKLEQK